MSTAALQRQWLERLERLRANDRPVFAQSHKEAAWLPWRDLPLDAVLWTRSLLSNELLWESDNSDKALNARVAESVAFAATLKGAAPIVADGGGKSWHVHAWIDPDSVELEDALLFEAELHGVDVWRIVREVVYDDVVKLAALPAGAKLDRQKIAWSAERMGSMVRDFGSVGSMGYAKTLTPPTLTFPDSDPALWRIGEYVNTIERRVKAAIAKAKRPKVEAAPTGDFNAHPCVGKALMGGAPSGERNLTGLHLLKLAHAEGLSFDEAQGVLSRYLAACGLPSDDKLRYRAEAIWREAPSSIACPNPAGLSVCAGVERCPRASLRLGAGLG